MNGGGQGMFIIAQNPLKHLPEYPAKHYYAPKRPIYPVKTGYKPVRYFKLGLGHDRLV